jgi:hypothetical protein
MKPRAAAIALCLLLVAVVAARVAARRSVEEPVGAGPVIAAGEDCVSSIACRACHPSQYASWHASYHRTMTQRATPDAIAGDVDVTLRYAGASYELERRGAETWVRIDHGSGVSEERRIALLTGSHHRQWLWASSGASPRLGAMPFIWLIDERRWIPRDAGFMLAPELGWADSYHEGGWGTGCVSCHTTRGEVATSDADEGRTVELGISCESCHGPAQGHVRHNRAPQERYASYRSDRTDDSIVNPERLPQPRSAEVCGQCHSVSLMASLTASDDRRLAARQHYRPGDDLASLVGAVRISGRLAESTRWPDGMSRSGGREYDAMIATPCYRSGEMTCLSCHRLHRAEDDARSLKEWADDQLGDGMRSDQACLQCHDARLAEHDHTRHEPRSEGSRCYNCHMPHTSYALLKAIRNHDVRGPTVAESLVTGRPNACNLCHLDKPLAWTGRYLTDWYGAEPPELGPDDERISAAVRWLLAGQAGQRGLVAWHMGWRPAQEASGSAWLPAYLAQLLDDPYPAVRIIAARSLRSLPGFGDFDHDYAGGEAELRAAREEAVARWQSQVREAVRAGDSALTDPSFALTQEEFARLVAERDPRRISWLE